MVTGGLGKTVQVSMGNPMPVDAGGDAPNPRNHSVSGRFTEPTLPDKTIVTEGGVRIEREIRTALNKIEQWWTWKNHRADR
jgi:hypothetical protein